jgi:hypothetical protein
MASIMSVARYLYNVAPPPTPTLNKIVPCTCHELCENEMKIILKLNIFLYIFPKCPRRERENIASKTSLVTLSRIFWQRGVGRGEVIFVGTHCFVSVVFFILFQISLLVVLHTTFFLMTYIDGGTTTLLLV